MPDGAGKEGVPETVEIEALEDPETATDEGDGGVLEMEPDAEKDVDGSWTEDTASEPLPARELDEEAEPENEDGGVCIKDDEGEPALCVFEADGEGVEDDVGGWIEEAD